MLSNYKKLLVSAFVATSLITVGCKKDYLETKPTNQINVNQLFETTQGAYTLLNGMHNLFTSAQPWGGTNAANWAQKSQDLAQDVMGTDVVLTNSGYDWFSLYYNYLGTEASTYWMPYNSWNFYYKLINNANALLDNIDAAAGSSSEKLDIKGQALAYRAWAYYRLASDFCLNPNAPGFAQAKGVPLMLTQTEFETVPKGRGLASEVYAQIKTDIQDAVNFLSTTSEARPNKSHINVDVARGIYARVALATNDFATAMVQAELVRLNYPLMSSQELLRGFNSNLNAEWIWASDLTAEQSNSRSLFCFMSWMDENAPGYANVGAFRKITKQLYDLIPTNDIRKEQFYGPTTGSGLALAQHKFFLNDRSTFNYNDLLMRSSEMYLIEIEARAHLNPNDPTAVDLLEEMMQIRQPGYTVAATGRPLLEETLLQRRIELWGEGFGIGDIKRLQKPLVRPTGTMNHTQAIAGVLNLPNNSPRFLFKIPQDEMDNNPSLSGADQNP